MAFRLRGDSLKVLILIFAVFLTYLPAFWAGFIWDDDYHVKSNPTVIGPLGLKEIWTTGAGQFFPLVLTTFWIEHALWGLNPLPYHLINVFQHAISTVLLWKVLRRLQIPGAWLGAALWALHPLQVESVAWISEMKNTQSGLFYLLAILFYVRWQQNGKDEVYLDLNYAFTLLCCALAMASKSSTLVLPAVLSLCVWWLQGRWHWRHLLGLMPILLMSAVAIIVTLHPWASSTVKPDPQWITSWPQRVAVSGYAIWFYLYKLLWPYPLMALYPRWYIDAGKCTSYLPLLTAIIVYLILWLKRNSWSRPFFFALTYFLITLSPFLGLIDQAFWRLSFVEDHLQYLAGMGPLALAGAGIIQFTKFARPQSFWLLLTFPVVSLLILGIMSWQRTWIFENEQTLWSDTLAKNPNAWMAHVDLGIVHLQKKEMIEAAAEFQKALVLNPNDTIAHDDLGDVLVKEGQISQAKIEYQDSLRIDPGDAEAYFDLGDVLYQQGLVEEAITHYQKALEINPDYTEAHYNLGNLLLQKGEVDDAIEQFQKTLILRPESPQIRTNLGNAYLQKGLIDEAIVQFEKALQISPNEAEPHCSLGVALAQKGKVQESIAQFKDALRLKPDFMEAKNNLALAEAKLRQGPLSP